MAHDKYKTQFTLIKGGKRKGDAAPEKQTVTQDNGKNQVHSDIAEQPVMEKKMNTPLSDTERLKMYHKGAKRGDADCQYLLAEVYYYGQCGVKKDERVAIDFYYKSADRGHKKSIQQLQFLEEKGNNELKDIAHAQLTRNKANQGNVEAQYELGLMYYNGRGLHKDKRWAADWLGMAAGQGHTTAQYRLALMYVKGDGVPQDEKQAVSWFSQAAEQGHADALNSLGELCEKGRGVPKDEKRAAECFFKATEQGHVDAKRRLRRMAERGQADAQHHWGTLAETGRGGVHQNIMHASAWYRKAAKQGHEKAKEALERLNG